jgi:hypothetical protein
MKTRSRAKFGRERASKLALAVSALTIAGAIQIARASPAGGYEISIYAGTPLLYWIGLAIGGGVALSVMVFNSHRSLNHIALFLVGLSIATVLGLPILRGYHFFGTGDSLIHLGRARIRASSDGLLFSLIYPGPFSYSFAFSALTGVSIRTAMVYVVYLFSLLFVVTLPACVRALFDSPRADALAVLSTVLILPLNNIGTSLVYKPVVQAILFTPLIFMFLFKHLQRTAEDDALPGPLTAAGLVLLLTEAALNFFHPQITVDVMILFIAIAIVQFALRRFRPHHPLTGTRAIYGYAAFLVLLFALWHTQHWKFLSSIQNMLESLQATVAGTQQVGQDATNRAESAQQIGSNPVILALKVLGVQLLYFLFALALVVLHASTGASRNEQDDMIVTYFTVGGLALAPYFFLQLLGTVSNHFFRHVGFMMVVVTIMGVVALYRGYESLLSRNISKRRLRAVGAVFIAILLVFSLASVYESPYIQKPNPHVTEQYLDGYESSFAAAPESETVWFGGIRGGITREKVALAASPSAPWDGPVEPIPRSTGALSPENMSSPAMYYENNPDTVVRRDHYVPVTDYDRGRSIVAFKSLYYNQTNFDSLANHPDTYPIRTNGDFTLYYVDTACDPVCEEAQEQS